MKGIIAIKNRRGRILGYNASQDIDETLSYYENGDTHWKRYMKNHPGAKITYEVLKVTDTPEVDVLEYKIPQVSRIIYDRGLLEGVAYRTVNYTAKSLRKAADWFCEAYPAQDASMDLHLNAQSKLEGTVRIGDGKEERYLFQRNGTADPIGD